MNKRMFPEQNKRNMSSNRNNSFSKLRTKSRNSHKVTSGSALQRPNPVTDEYCDNTRIGSSSEMDLRTKLNKQRCSTDTESHPQISGSDLPEVLYSCPAQLVAFQPQSQSGLIDLRLEGGPPVSCFFTVNQVYGDICLYPGTPVLVCARCVSPQGRVPYLALILWRPDNPSISHGMVDSVMARPPDPMAWTQYRQFADQLQLQLSQPQQDQPPPPKRFRPGPDTRGLPSDISQTRSQTRGLPSDISQTRSQTRGLPSDISQPRGLPSDISQTRGLPSDISQTRGLPSDIRQTRGLPSDISQTRGQTRGQSTELTRSRQMSFVVTNLTEEFPERGIKAVVDKYFCKGVGQLSVVNSSGKKLQKVLFHVNHVWKNLDNSFGKHNSQGHSPFLETNTYEELEKQLDVGSSVSLNARKISGTCLPLQATAVWVSTLPPSNYKTPHLVADLATKLNDFIFSQTGDVKYRSNPLYMSPDKMVAGEVKEYLSYETGLIVLESGPTALFHLNQVWTETEKKVLYKTVQDKLLQQYLPIGAKVWVNYREIPAGEQSDLKYQATIVYSRVAEGKTDDIPKEYIERFQPFEARVALVSELDRIHDLVKKNLRRHRLITNTNFIPVHAVLNGLPEDWIAEIVAAVDQDFGIIKISHARGHSLGRGVHILYALFHIEDVYDYHGLPSIQNPNITMNNVMNCKVNLTARSISCREQDPEKLMDVQRELTAGGGEAGAVPLLQAVVVCLKLPGGSQDTNSKHIPKPTSIRAKPNSFGDLGAFFYLNPLLFAKLDLKLKEFLAIRKKLNLPYDKILKSVSIGKNHEKNILETWRELDVNKSYQFDYGKLPANMEIVPDAKGLMPRILTKHPVKLVYIHRSSFKADSGIFELEVEVGGDKVTTFAYFELAKYKFFSPADSFATDLVNVMRVSSTDRFCIHAMLTGQSGSRIPYIALSVWNEDLRLEMNKDVPLDFKYDAAYAGSTKGKVNAIVNLLEKPAATVQLSESLELVFPSDLPVPDSVGTVTNDVKLYDGNKVMMENNNRGLVTVINNRVGYINRILTDHLAILTFKHKERMYKVLVSAEDVFLLELSDDYHNLRDFQNNNKLKFSSPKDLWALTAANKNISLFDVLKPDQKVTFNAVPLLSNPDTNNADIWYVSGGVLVTTTFRPHVTVPVTCVATSNKLTQAFKMFFMKIIRNVTSDAQFEPESIPGKAPPKFPPNFYQGAKGRLALRPEYLRGSNTNPETQTAAPSQIPKSLSLPAPVSVKKPPPKPIPWDPIISRRYGKVLKVIDKNYGVAASYFPLYDDSNECETFQFLFDIFDIYVGDRDCNDLGKKLPDVLSVGDFVKFNAVKVMMEGSESERDIRYMATSMITDTGVEDIRERDIPDSAPVITDLSQVTASKIENFKVVSGFLNNIKPSLEEEDIIKDINSGGLLSKFASRVVNTRKSSPVEIVPQANNDEGSDEEITVIETVSGNNSQAAEIPIGDLKPKELRSLISCYNAAVNRQTLVKTRGKYNLQKLKDETKLAKELGFFEDFLLSLGRKCHIVKTGFKVGPIFVTNFQVKSIMNYGIKNKEDIEDDVENNPNVKQNPRTDDKEVLKQIPFSKMRKFIIDFHNFLCSILSLEEVSRNAEMSVEQCRLVMKAVEEAVEEAPVVGGKVQGIKVNNIFISSSWVQKIQEHHRKTRQ